MLTAIVHPVKIGHLEIEGLLFPDGSFGVAVPQLTALNLIPPNRSLKQLEALLGKTLQTHQKVKTKLHPKAVNVINLDELTDVVVASANQGNQIAKDLRDDLVGVALVQLFSDAFGHKFEADDRQSYLKEKQENRQATIDSFHFLTAEIKQYLDTYGSSNPASHYPNAFRAMSKGLFGKDTNLIKEELGLGSAGLSRNHFGNESLRRIDTIQRLAAPMIAKGVKPTQAVKNAVEAFDYPIINYTI